MRAVVDTVVFYRAMFGKRVDTHAKRVTDLVVDQRIQAFSCDVFLGEITRIIRSDERLRGMDQIYLNNYIVMIEDSLNLVEMKYLEHDQKWLNLIGNDWYLIALARFKNVDYLITHDKRALIDRRDSDWKDEAFKIVTSAEYFNGRK